jgi:hypothetical protein
VADFFCGSGTFAAVASRHGRRFIANDATWRALHTTRARLVAQSSPPFSLLVTPESSLYESDVHINPSAITLDEKEILLRSDLTVDLDYWEVDPAWDGQVFRSAAQAVRPRRKGFIADRLELPLAPKESTVKAYLVKINGEQQQFTIPRD